MRTAYASHSHTARQMLAIWLDARPSVTKDQRDPDGWSSQAPETDFAAKRLAELAKAPDVRVVWIAPQAAEWWCRIEHGRRLSVSRAHRDATKGAQPPLFEIPDEMESEGRREGYARIHAKGRL